MTKKLRTDLTLISSLPFFIANARTNGKRAILCTNGYNKSYICSNEIKTEWIIYI